MKDYPVFSGTPACAETDPEMWFPVDEKSKMYLEPALLERICTTCEVKEECFNYALNHAVSGYWAGTTGTERQRIRSKLKIKAIPLIGSTYE